MKHERVEVLCGEASNWSEPGLVSLRVEGVEVRARAVARLGGGLLGREGLERAAGCGIWAGGEDAG